MACLNIASLPRHIDELRIILYSKCLDLLAINETCLHDIIADNEVSIDGYDIVRRDRPLNGGGRNRIGRREKWPKLSWEEGEIGGKSREEGEKEKLTFREEGEIGSKSREEREIGSQSRERGDLPPCSTPL